MSRNRLHPAVTEFLNQLKHPLRKEIDILRECILSANEQLSENIKWNGPNYCVGQADRITMKIQPPKNIQLIFHCGAKKQKAPAQRLINDDKQLLEWRGNDRAIATFTNMNEIQQNKTAIRKLVADWLTASCE